MRKNLQSRANRSPLPNELRASGVKAACGTLANKRKRREHFNRLRPAQIPVLYLYSEVHMLAIRLPQSIEKRLEALARRTGRTKTYYVREAILEYLDDLEDLYLAERSLERIRNDEERPIPLKDVMKRYGVES